MTTTDHHPVQKGAQLPAPHVPRQRAVDSPADEPRVESPSVEDTLARWQKASQQARLRRLLRHREQLAVAAIEHTGHDLPGADWLWQCVHRVEEEVRRDYPAVWAQRNAAWAVRDGARLHTAEHPRPDACRICARVTREQAVAEAS